MRHTAADDYGKEIEFYADIEQIYHCDPYADMYGDV